MISRISPLGFVFVLIVTLMAWQAAPALAGFTPTPAPPPTDTPVPPPTDTPVPPPTDTPVPPPPTATSRPASGGAPPPAPTETPVPTPVVLPVTGGQGNEPPGTTYVAVALVGVFLLLLLASRQVIIIKR